ncbi:MarR family transcriptional regulator [Neisseriaceae bacterium TC5R-5]|nr:MarR family transcriptional regulator [Neisseriaceae bacterium TC5R-5]
MPLFDLIERLANLQLRTLTDIPAFKSLPQVQVRALYYLFRCNHYSNTPSAVTEYLGLTKGTVSQSLRKLEEQGLIARESDIQDKRKVKLLLSDYARGAIAAALRQESITLAQQALPDNRLDLEQGLIQILRIVQQTEGIRLFGVCQQCRFHLQQNGSPYCDLTKEVIPADKTTLICREFEIDCDKDD